MSYYLATDGSAHPNPAYSVVPRLVRIPAAEWSDAPRSPLYLKLLLEPSSFEWLSEAPTVTQTASPSCGLGMGANARQTTVDRECGAPPREPLVADSDVAADGFDACACFGDVTTAKRIAAAPGPLLLYGEAADEELGRVAEPLHVPVRSRDQHRPLEPTDERAGDRPGGAPEADRPGLPALLQDAR